MVIKKRIFRQFKTNLVLYIAIFVIIVLGMGVVLGGLAGGDSIVWAIKNNYEAANVEDGHFSVSQPLLEAEETILSDSGGIIEDQSYLDISVKDKVLRVFAVRKEINQITPDSGALPVSSLDIFLEKHFAANNGYEVGDSFVIESISYTVCGIGSVPDYNYVLRDTTDLTSNTEMFSVAFLSQTTFDELMTAESDGIERASFTYAYRLSGPLTDLELKEIIAQETEVILTAFVPRQDNPRITEYEVDCATVSKSSMVFSIFYIALIGYIIAIFASHTVEKEGQAIGALYAMGYNRQELVKSYLILPVMVSFISGIFSLIVGFTVFPRLITSDTIALYSFPEFEIFYPGYLIAMGVLLPTVFTLVINYLVLSHKLNETPLALLKNIKKHTTRKSIHLHTRSYIKKFQVRYMIREKGRIFTLFLGLFAASLLLLLGASMYGSVDNYVKQVKNDVIFEYMYTLSGPISEADNYDKLEKAFVQNMKHEANGHSYNITVMGIRSNNPYFDYDVSGINNTEMIISNAVAKKFGVQIGAEIELFSNLTDETYVFTVADIVDYSSGLYVFTATDHLIDLFEMDNEYYNAVFSDQEITFSDNQSTLTTVTSSYLIESAQQMQDNMMLMVGTLIFAAGIVFIVVVYLIAKLMIEKSAFSISMLKIVGYQPNEINKIYLNSIFAAVLVSIAVSLSLGSVIIKVIYPYLVADYNAYIAPYISMPMYVILFVFMILTYLIVSLFLKRYLKHISFGETLKNRE